MHTTNSLTVGDHIPNFNLKSIEGLNFSISEIIGKNNLVLHFFKTIKDYTCGTQATNFNTFARNLGKKNTKLVAISSKMSSDKDFQDQLLQKLGKSVNLLNDDEDELRAFFGLCLSSDPMCNNMTFVVDRFGKISARIENLDNVSTIMERTLEVINELK